MKSYLMSPEYDFSFEPREDVKILSGQDEGKYAWIATNMLLGKLTSAAKASTKQVLLLVCSLLCAVWLVTHGTYSKHMG